MKRSILILTELGDTHGYAVAEALIRRGAEVTLWHTPDFPSRAGETLHFENGRWAVRMTGPAVSLDEFQFDAVWHRRCGHAIDETKLHPADLQFADMECCLFRRSLFGFLATDSFWVNPPDAAIRAARKPLQHRLACEVGFATPATIYTNDPGEIRSFLNRHGGQIVYKPFHGISWRDGETRWTPYTNIITESLLVEDDLLRATPGIYQEVVDKEVELRITVMGERVFGVKIYSQETREGRLDWRRSYDELRMQACEVPLEVAEQCRRLLARLGLVFGCIDIIVTPEGEHVFLEVNQMGQFLFLERYAGIPLLDAFAELLFQARPDYEWEEEKVRVRYADVLRTVPRMEADLARLHVPSLDRSVWEDTEQTGHQQRVSAR